MYHKHLNGGVMKINSSNVNFLNDEFPIIGEIKKDLKLYPLRQDLQLSIGEGEDLILTKSSRMVHLPYPIRTVEVCLFGRVRYMLNL